MKDQYVAQCRALINALLALMATVLKQESTIKAITEQCSQVKGTYFVGRNLGYQVDMVVAKNVS